MEGHKHPFGRSVSMPMFQMERGGNDSHEEARSNHVHADTRQQASGLNMGHYKAPDSKHWTDKVPMRSDGHVRHSAFGRPASSSTKSSSSVESEATIKPSESHHGTSGFESAWNRGQRNAYTTASSSEKTWPQKHWLPGLEHRSPDTDKTSPPKELYVPGGFGYHRRVSSRLSLAPLLTSSPGVQKSLDSNADVSSMMSPDSLLQFQLPKSRKQGAAEAKKCPEKLDLHVLKVSANVVGSPYHRPQSFGFGHARTITDPFIDNLETSSKSPMHMPSSGNHNTLASFGPPDQASKMSAFKFPAHTNNQHDEGNNGSPTYQGFDSPYARRDYRIPNAPVFQPIPPMTPGHTSQSSLSLSSSSSSSSTTSKTTTRADLPIPPPPLSSIQGQVHHSPETRARLDARAASRADWIRSEATKIAELRRKSFAAEQQYRATNAPEDLIAWQELAGEYADATDLDKRQEERRNMFMPGGMRAMRTGAENMQGDESASYHDQGGKRPRQGALLGFHMAFMERVGAEVERRNDEHEGDEITKEMLAVLTKDEKKVLRQYLVDRLKENC
ncbi:hypothetical protein ACEQ8H_007444 [Pleosporales sp. CAS-2024a]